MIPKNIPRKAKFSGRIYKVRKVSATKMPKADQDDTVHVGFCDSDATEILILKDLSHEAQRGSFEHEAGHASAEESGVRAIMAKFTNQYEELEEHLCRVWLPCYLEGLRVKVK